MAYEGVPRREPAVDEEQEEEEDAELMTARTSARGVAVRDDNDGFSFQHALKGILVTGGAMCVLAVVLLTWPHSAHGQGRQSLAGAMKEAVKLQASGESGVSSAAVAVDEEYTKEMKMKICVSTANWTDGFSLCNSDGTGGPGLCTPQGNTCEAYAVNQWCYDLKPVTDFAQQEERNSPHLNCCVCGGGSLEMHREPASGLKVQTCSSYTACAGQSGDCCPNAQGQMLQCCHSQPVCQDAADWKNGFTGCVKEGFNETDGCTIGGVTCHGYELQGLCANGAIVPGKEWAHGPSFNHPEQNCCVCGGGTASTAVSQRLLRG